MASSIKEATIYLKGAQITRTQVFKLSSGSNSVVFEHLPSNMDARSIIVSADGATVLSVAHNSTYSQSESEKRINDLMEKLEKLQKELTQENSTMDMLYYEEELLKNNTRADSGKVFRASDVKDTVIFFRDRMGVILSDRMTTQNNIERLNQEISAVQAEIGMDRASRQRSEVRVDVYSDGKKDAELKLSYFTYDASWTPYYDVRAKDVGSPVTIQSKAMVYQNTGEDWKDVSITLSTGNPSLSGDVPELRPWYIDLYVPVQRDRARKSVSDRMMMSEELMDMDTMAAEPISMSMVSNAPVENMTSVEYVLKAPYSIQSSGSGRSVDIDSHDLPAEFVYKSVRKLEKDVFLIAEIKGWEKLNLIEGSASIFFEGKYVGTTVIDPKRADESLIVSLGRDKNVIVTRVRGKDFTSRSVLGNTKASREWELTVKNLKKQKISMILEDQVPVSVNKSITVDAVSISGAEMDKETGKLEWKFDLEPAESRSMNVKYEVTYPKSGSVVLE